MKKVVPMSWYGYYFFSLKTFAKKNFLYKILLLSDNEKVYFLFLIKKMDNLNLVAELRNKQEKTKYLRKDKVLPWIVYWKKQEPIVLKLNYSDFLKTFRKSWESHIINLKVNEKNIEVLVNATQKEPVTWDFMHVDFFAITKWEIVTTKIRLEFVWSSETTKNWGIIEEHMKEIEIRCLPRDLKDSFEVDLSLLKELWDNIKVNELNIDEKKYEILSSKNDIVVSTFIPKKVEIEEVVPETEEKSEEAEGKSEEKPEEWWKTKEK